MAAPTIAAGLRQLLTAHAPFSEMDPADVDAVIDAVDIAYFGPGEIVLAPSSGVTKHCMIVKQGRVQGTADDERIAYEAGVGDCFPMGALLAERPVTLTYRSVGDTFCMRLPRERFVELVQRSAPFRDFSTRRLGAMLELLRQQLQQTYAAEASAERTMGTPLGELLRGPALACSPETPLRDAFLRMEAAHIGSVLVVENAWCWRERHRHPDPHRSDRPGDPAGSSAFHTGARRHDAERVDARCRCDGGRRNVADGRAFDQARPGDAPRRWRCPRCRRRVRARALCPAAADGSAALRGDSPCEQRRGSRGRCR